MYDDSDAHNKDPNDVLILRTTANVRSELLSARRELMTQCNIALDLYNGMAKADTDQPVNENMALFASAVLEYLTAEEASGL